MWIVWRPSLPVPVPPGLPPPTPKLQPPMLFMSLPSSLASPPLPSRSPSSPPPSPLPSLPPPWPPPRLPPRPPPRPRLLTIDAINARYRRRPDSAPWSADGSAPSAGLLVHCFDGWGREQEAHPWRPSLEGHDTLGNPNDSPGPLLLSCSLVWSEQCTRAIQDGQHGWPGAWLFGHGCESGGVILRPGPTTRIVCGNAHDAGGYCHDLCPAIHGGDADAPCDDGSWRPEDAPAYLHRQGRYRNYYNEFLCGAQR